MLGLSRVCVLITRALRRGRRYCWKVHTHTMISLGRCLYKDYCAIMINHFSRSISLSLSMHAFLRGVGNSSVFTKANYKVLISSIAYNHFFFSRRIWCSFSTRWTSFLTSGSFHKSRSNIKLECVLYKSIFFL